MKDLKKTIVSVLVTLGFIISIFGFSAPAANAANPCGFFSYNGYSYYNHCGKYNAYIQVDQVIGKYTMCVAPGTTLLRKNDGGLYQITNAFYLRNC